MIPVPLILALASSVPSIAKMLGVSDNVTKVAEVASSVLKKVTGFDDDEAGIAALNQDPALLAQYKLAMIEKERDFEALYVADKNSARQRDVELAKVGIRNNRADILVGFLVALIIALLAAVVFLPALSEFAKGVITMFAGFVTNQLANVMGFEFGTTRKEAENNSNIIKDYISIPGAKKE